LAQVLTQRTLAVFAPFGVTACALLLPDDADRMTVRSAAHAQSWLDHLDAPEHLAQAEAARHSKQITALVAPHAAATHLTCFIPLFSGDKVVGVLSLSGQSEITGLLARVRTSPEIWSASSSDQAGLFAAFCDQAALALDRAALQQTAIHVAALQETDRLKNALLGSVTHDLRTPIAAIQAAASSLEQPDVDWSAPERDLLLHTVTTSSDRLARLVDNLLALSRLEAGATPPQKAAYPINDVIATVLDQLECSGVIKEHVITLDITGDPLEAPMDHTQIERVVMNLVENAVKYSPPGSPIAIKSWRADAELWVSVMDHGVGIPSAQLQAIFDRFYRLRPVMPWARTMPQGTGLGLAICAGIVREHGGRIWAESHEGQGATLTFTLPFVLDAAPTETRASVAVSGGQV
jgi:two-component system, OmpR family, sensor histidine kinase KdpD